jgi:hypothetical protein
MCLSDLIPPSLLSVMLWYTVMLWYLTFSFLSYPIHHSIPLVIYSYPLCPCLALPHPHPHPHHHQVLASLFSGQCFIWDTNAPTLLKIFEVSDLPVRSAKFVERKGWVVTGAWVGGYEYMRREERRV